MEDHDSLEEVDSLIKNRSILKKPLKKSTTTSTNTTKSKNKIKVKLDLKAETVKSQIRPKLVIKERTQSIEGNELQECVNSALLPVPREPISQEPN